MKRSSRYKLVSLLLVFSMIVSFFAVPVSHAVAGEGDVLSVSEAIANNSGSATVGGYIVGHTTGTNSYDFEEPYGNPYNIAIADSPNETDPANILPVQLPRGVIRDALNLVDHPEHVGNIVQVTGSLEAYFGVPGMKGTSSYSFETEEEPSLGISKIADARLESKGSDVKIKGIVTARFEAGSATNLFVQDDTAGIIVRAPGIAIEPGDEIIAQGEMSDYYGMQQILATPLTIEVAQPEAGIPDPLDIQSNDLMAENGEALEGMFVKVQNVTITEDAGYGNFTAIDAAGSFTIKPPEKDWFEIGKTYDILLGVIDYNFGEYKLVPRSKSDVIETAFSVSASPAGGIVEQGTQVELTSGVTNADIYYTLDGSEPTIQSNQYNSPIEMTTNTVIKAIAVTNGVSSPVAVFTFEIKTEAPPLRIHDVQGAGHTSPYVGQTVSDVEGIVTATSGSNAFYMQDPHPDNDVATSEGIFVYKRGSGVAVGDKVRVSGQVKEWRERGYADAKDLLTTEISAFDVEVVSSGNTVPEPVVIGVDRAQPTEIIEDDHMASFDPESDGLDFFESLEGMLVQLNNPQVVAPPKYDEIAVFVETSPEQMRTSAGGLLISASDYNPERILVDVEGYDVSVKVGDSFAGAITGVISYDYSNFKLRTVGNLPQVEEGGLTQEVTAIEPDDAKLTVASYNIENFSAETSQEKITKIAHSIIKNLKAPDIIGLIEVQDNNGPVQDGTTDASESYQELIDAVIAAGGPAYQYTDIAPNALEDGGQPGGNIRVGFIYNPERVKMTDKPKGDADTAVVVDENGLSHNPGRIDPGNNAFEDSRKPLAAEFLFQGEKVIVVANHFNSKGGDGALFGAEHPIVLGSEVQRLEQAAVVNNFVTSAVSAIDDANVVVLGDLNDFEFSQPLQVLKGDVLVNLVEELPLNERYSYIYQGNSQVLDHILVSRNLLDRAVIDSVNINADFSEAHGRASDHDPMLAQLLLDDTAPITDISLPEADLSDGSYLGEMTFTLSATDEGTGVAKTEYSLDGGQVWHLYDGPVTITNENTTEIQYYSIDNAGNTEAVKSTLISITEASLSSLYEIVEGLDSSHGVKTALLAHLDRAAHHFRKGSESDQAKGYHLLEKTLHKISKYQEKHMNPNDKADLRTIIYDLLEQQ